MMKANNNKNLFKSYCGFYAFFLFFKMKGFEMVKCESLRINMYRITHTGKISKFSRNSTHIPTGCESLFTSFRRLKESKLLQKRLNQGTCNTFVLTRLFGSLKWNLIKCTFSF